MLVPLPVVYIESTDSFNTGILGAIRRKTNTKQKKKNPAMFIAFLIIRIKYLTRSNLREKKFLLFYSLQRFSSSWWEKQAEGTQGSWFLLATRTQIEGCLFHLILFSLSPGPEHLGVILPMFRVDFLLQLNLPGKALKNIQKILS